MRWPLLIAIALLAACSAPPVHDDAYRQDLRTAALATFDAMGLPADRRPSARALTDTIGTLAMQSTLQRVAAVRDGTVSALDLDRDAAACLRALRERGAVYRPPELLTWLHAHLGEATVAQRLLLDALVHQAEREVGLR